MAFTGQLNDEFQYCIDCLMQYGMKSKPRGVETRELLNYNITLSNPRNRVITFEERKTSMKYLMGEFIWYLSGSNDPAGILPYSKFWNNIRNGGSMPGYPAGSVNSNYGHRLFGHHNGTTVPYLEYHMTPSGHDEAGKMIVKAHETPVVRGQSQWDATIELLKKDPDTRQAVMNIHIPEDRHEGNKDVACTETLQFFIRENKLHLIVNMRSNDIIRGFTNDVFQFTMLQECMLLELRETYPDLELGLYFHNAGSMHIYDLHFEMADQITSSISYEETVMAPMDAFNEKIKSALVKLEQEWMEDGMRTFDKFEAWSELTPYWKSVMKTFFLNDTEAHRQLFTSLNFDEEE